MRKYVMDRRQFLRYLAYGGIFTVSQPLLSACRPLLSEQTATEFHGDPDVEIRLTAKPDVQQIFTGSPTEIWRYQGEVLKGPSDTLISLPGSYLGPTISVKPGTQLRVYFANELPEQSIVHWHGLHVPDHADGHPRLAVGSGETYVYNYRVMDRAGTYWYHPHPHGRTGPQVYLGLAGLFLIHDDEEASLDLPAGEKDLPIVIQDRIFDRTNQLDYNRSGMMSQMLGMLGDEILVNGLPDAKITVDRGAYRLRLMNGSNARIYKLAWDDGTPLHVIGTDGGLLERPLVRDYVTLAPAQRLDVWVDFGAWEPGTNLQMVNLPSAAPGGGSEFPIFTASIQDTVRQAASLPERLTRHEVLDSAQAVNANAPRVFTLEMGRGMRWTINGRQFDMKDVARDERVQLGDIEVWEFFNQGSAGMGMGMGMMSQPHPMHVHGLQFKVVERRIDAGEERAYQSLKDGFVDEGWHDTILVMPGERVRILMHFKDFSGLYLYHCHILEHEDMGMMRNYQVITP
ncbi:MAG: multicopper oxidase domain-containing protein [Brevefilum sp.]|nr:multicopper oxidase domain-containing protein [Brevefilum sp.]